MGVERKGVREGLGGRGEVGVKGVLAEHGHGRGGRGLKWGDEDVGKGLSGVWYYQGMDLLVLIRFWLF